MNYLKRNFGSKSIIMLSILLFSIIGTIYAVLGLLDLKYRGYKITGTTIKGVIYTGDIGSASRNFSTTYIKEHGTCRALSDSSSTSFFIPTRTVDEWGSYITNKPATTTLFSCGCKTDSDCGVGKVCNGYVAPAGTCVGEQENSGICRYGSTLPGSCSVEEGPCGDERIAGTCSSRCHLNQNVICERDGTSCGGITSSNTCNTTAGCSWTTTTPETLGYCTLSAGSSTSCISGTPAACFVAGTQVKLPDNSTINIEDITQSMQVLGANNEIQTVQKPLKIRYTGKLHTINNSDYFVTASHPFMTTQGWKSFDPDVTKTEIPDLLVTKLEIGDILVKEKGLEKLYKSEYREVNQYVYNLVLDGNHTYYADGYLVHNKLDLGPGCTYNVACASNACVGGSCVSSTTTPSVYACCSCTVKAQCPFTYDCISNKCTKTGVTCSSTSVSLCGACTSTSQCPVNSYCNTTYGMCRPSSGPPCAL